MVERGFAEFYKVEGGEVPYFLSGIRAETLYWDLRTDGADLGGDLTSGFEYTAKSLYNGTNLSRVRVTPVDAKDVPEDVRVRLTTS